MDYWHSYFERLSKKYKLKVEIRENEHKILFFIKFYKLQIYRTERTNKLFLQNNNLFFV